MILGVGRGCLASDNEAPSMLGTAIVETNMDDVELYIDGELIGSLSKVEAAPRAGPVSGCTSSRARRPATSPIARKR